MYKVNSSSDYLHRISELTGVPMSIVRTLTDYFKLAICHDVYNALQDDDDSPSITIPLLNFGDLTILCDPITTELSYSINLYKSFDKMIKEVYDKNASPLVTKIEKSVIDTFTKKFEDLGLTNYKEDDDEQ